MATTMVYIEGLIVEFWVGVPEDERSQRQPIHLDITCDLGSPTIRCDDIGETLNYVMLYDSIQRLAKEQVFVLIETLAEAIAHLCFQDKRVLHVTVRVRKPNKLPNCAFVGVTRTFDRSEVVS